MGIFDKIKRAFESDNTKEDNNKIKENIPQNKEIKEQKQYNFSYLDNLIHCGDKKITLEGNVILEEGEAEKYPEGIHLDVDDIFLDGNGHIIDAQGLRRIFKVRGKNIVLKNITLKNGNAEYGGGAIENEYNGIITLKNILFTNNKADAYGGAIYNFGQLIIINTIFKKNYAEYNGGAIANRGTTNIKNSTLTNNTATENGGAIHNNGKLTITDSILTENTAKNGGALNINYDQINKEITETKLVNSDLTKNEAKNGGTIHNQGNCKIFNCKISYNNSLKNIISNQNSLKLYNILFTDNHAPDIILNSDKANITIQDTKFKRNYGEKSIINNTGNSCIIEGSYFENNMEDGSKNMINENELTLINNKINDKRKSIINNGHIVIKKSSEDIENKIEGKGTVEKGEKTSLVEKYDFEYLDKKIHENTHKEIILEGDIYLENYEKSFYEGGIELDIDDLVIDGNGYIIDGRDKSRIFIITGKNITLKNLTFKNGRSYFNLDNPFISHGGAIKTLPNTKVNIENCEFINNTSEESGGAIDNAGQIILANTKLLKNEAKSGGAINNVGEITIKNNLLIKNMAKFGGAITNNGKMIIIRTSFTENTAGSGGAINNYNKISIKDTCIKDNIAEVFGGGIINTGSIILQDSKLDKNIAIGTEWHKGEGGAICTEIKDNIKLINCEFKDNKPNNIQEEKLDY